MLDGAVVAEPDVPDAAAVTGAQIPAHPVVAELVVVRTVAERHPARPRRCRREQFVADGHVRRDRVVVHVHVQVQAVLQLGTRGQAGLALAGARIRVGGAPDRVAGRKLALADIDATRERSRVVGDPVVGDLDVVPPAVHEDAATPLGAVGDAQAVDGRGVAPEVAAERIGRIRAARGAIGGRQQRRASRESAGGRRPDSERIRPWRIFHSSRQHCDGGPFQRAHQAGLLQQLGQVPVLRDVPADHGFQRQSIHLELHRRRAGEGPGRIIRIAAADGIAIERQSEQAIDLPAPDIQLARGMGIGVDDAGGGPHALQPHGLPHQQDLVVGAGRHDDQVAR